MKRDQAIWKNAVSLAVACLLTVAIAGPAAAAESGSGDVTGGTWSDETQESSNPFCGGKVTSSSHSWDETGTFTASSGAVVFSGTSSVSLSSSSTYWFDQQGSYQYGGCAANPNNTVGYSVPATITVTGGSGSNAVSCSNMSGSFRRTNIVDVDVTATGSCTINGSTTVNPTTITWDLLVPLDPVTFTPFIDSGTYTQT